MTIVNQIALTIGGKTARSKYTPKAVELSWDALPAESQNFLIAYGIKQYLGDGAAGAETQADFDTGIADRLAQIAEGTCGKRQAAETKGPTDDPEKVAKQIATDEVSRRIKESGAKIEKEQKANAIARYLEKNKEALLAQAVAEIAKRKKAASAIDLDDLLGLTDDADEA